MVLTTPAARRGLLALATAGVLMIAPVAAAGPAERRPEMYRLDGDLPGPAHPVGSKFEGIGVDRSLGVFYVPLPRRCGDESCMSTASSMRRWPVRRTT